MILIRVILIYHMRSRATFDNYVKNGWIPKGYKQDGFKELSWMKSDLDFYLDTYSNNK